LKHQIDNPIKAFEGDVRSFPWAQNKLDLDGESYYEDTTHFNHSLLQQGLRNPERLGMMLAGWVDPTRDTAAMQFGRAFHLGILEPEKYNKKFYIFDDAEMKHQVKTGKRTTRNHGQRMCTRNGTLHFLLSVKLKRKRFSH
jgi:hypothetical protein